MVGHASQLTDIPSAYKYIHAPFVFLQFLLFGITLTCFEQLTNLRTKIMENDEPRYGSGSDGSDVNESSVRAFIFASRTSYLSLERKTRRETKAHR